ncbi:hypothetical protein FA95DRAFT_1684332 [Auriscalpium vulgare]|uniref:Uncharacterized protein n=1 Tax=Auriscalpium vulgare TaxID=40419 RepID=A0ACB8R5F9_9AGAM|nr:hypothetical protein FA95DRAFT_1684332 [Auriscalpium vulgare]
MPGREDADSTVNVPNIPVSRLPPEILCLVFFILSKIDHPNLNRPQTDRRKYKLGWVTVTHVCQRWRTVALSDPALWASNIALPSVLGDCWAATFVTRAQNLPLTFGAIIFSMTAPPWRSPIPRSSALISRPSRLLPDALFGGAASLPELRHLSVEAFDPRPWIPLLLAQLVTVDMSFQLTGAEIVSILAALERMPALERLSLWLSLRLSPEDTEVVPVTLLPALRHLTLDSGINEVSILTRLALPPGVHVSCGIHWTAGAAAELPTLFPAMVTCAHAAAISRVDVKLTAAADYARNVEVNAWRSGNTDGTPALTVRFSGWTDVPAVLKFFASTHLEELAVGGDVPDASWLDAFGSARRLHHVTVKAGAVLLFCTKLTGNPGVLTALHTLVINVRGLPLAKLILEDTLRRCLAARASRSGILLKELEVVGYDEDEACVRALRAAMPGLVVRWRQ